MIPAYISNRSMLMRVGALSKRIGALHGDVSIVLVKASTISSEYIDLLVSNLRVEKIFDFSDTVSERISGSQNADVVLLLGHIQSTGNQLQRQVEGINQVFSGSVVTAVLLQRYLERSTSMLQPDWVGFTIPDVFVVGHGLGLDGQYESLPYLGVYEPGAEVSAQDRREYAIP